jgi:hypothetical protein
MEMDTALSPVSLRVADRVNRCFSLWSSYPPYHFINVIPSLLTVILLAI